MSLKLCSIALLTAACINESAAQPHDHGAKPAPKQPPAAKPAGVLVDPGAATPREAAEAIAVLAPTKGSKVSGTVRFKQTAGGVEVVADVKGLPAGTHAYHVHVFGDCSSPDGKSAGPHFHFGGSSFDKHVAFITGNLGELAAKTGAATEKATIKDASIQGAYSILGRAVIVHAKPNDPKVTPDGGAGDRIACGVIGMAQVLDPQ